MQFSQMWTGLGTQKRLLGRLCWPNQVYRELKNQSEARELDWMEQGCFLQLTEWWAENGSSRALPTGRYQAFGVKGEALPDTKEATTPSWKRNDDHPEQGWEEGATLLPTAYIFPGASLPKVTMLVRLLPCLEVIQSYCRFLWVRKVAYEGICIVGQGGKAPKSVFSFENWGRATSL